MKLPACVLTVLCLCASCSGRHDAAFERAVRESVGRQIGLYPESTLKDIYKSFFQDRFGPGHLIGDRDAAERYLLSELDSCGEAQGEIAEPTGWQHNFYRVDLSVLKDGTIPHELFLDAFVRSANETEPVQVEKWREEWQAIEKIVGSMELHLPGYDKDLVEIGEKLKEGNYVCHHSEAYRKAYRPHYRIVSKKIYEEEILPLINKHNSIESI